jgi:hypothetical protein
MGVVIEICIKYPRGELKWRSLILMCVCVCVYIYIYIYGYIYISVTFIRDVPTGNA